jgi:hypothetical protein
MAASMITAFDELRRSGNTLVLVDTFVDDSPDNSKGDGFLATRYEGPVEELRRAWGEPAYSGSGPRPIQGYDPRVSAWWQRGENWAVLFVTEHDAGSLLNLWICLSELGPDA